MDKLAHRAQGEQGRRDKLAKAMQESLAQIAEGFRQLMEASESEDARDQVRTRARHIIEEARLNYDQAVQEIRRLQEDERNERLEAVARSSMYSMWAMVVVAVASVGL